MAESTSEPGGSGGMKSVDRALEVLDLLARWGEGGVSDLARELDVHKSTAFRLLGSLDAHGLVEQAEDRGKYRLGFGLVRLAGAVSSRMDLTRNVRPVAERLAKDIGETVNLAVLREHYVVNIDQALGPSSVTAQNWVGALTPLHATSSGKVLLAHEERREQQRLLKVAGLKKYTRKTITDPEVLEKQLASILEHGYAVTLGEYEEDLNSIAVPVKGADRAVVGALSASGPSYRFTVERMEELAGTLLEAGAQASLQLSHMRG